MLRGSFIFCVIVLLVSLNASEPIISILAPTGNVTPLFTCWYMTYASGGVRLRNVVLGYNSTYPSNVNIPQGANNIFVTNPGANLTGDITSFATGHQRVAFYVRNVTTLSWIIDGNTLSLPSTLVLTNETLCLNVFNRACPNTANNINAALIEGFCEDGDYCNGVERCNATGGVCISAANTSCPGQECNESSFVCIQAQPPPPITDDAPTNTPTPPTNVPTKQPTSAPTKFPTAVPTNQPTTSTPTKAPTAPTTAPTVPTQAPTKSPTAFPTKTPTKAPTNAPTAAPTGAPVVFPTNSPTPLPTTAAPTNSPTPLPTTPAPTNLPTMAPTNAPTNSPTILLTPAPTSQPTVEPTNAPSRSPTSQPTSEAPTSVACQYCTFNQSDYSKTCYEQLSDQPFEDAVSNVTCAALALRWTMTPAACLVTHCYCKRIFVLGNATNGGFTVNFTSAVAVDRFLIVTTPPAIFNGNLNDPLTTPAGSFAGELLTVKINIAFSSFLPYNLSLLAFSPVCGQVHALIRGRTLLEVIFIADQVIGGDPLNLYPAFTPAILTQALALYNNNFANCNNLNPLCFTCTWITNSVLIPLSKLKELSERRLPVRRVPKSIQTAPISSDRPVDVPILVIVFVFVTVVVALQCLASWIGKRANREYKRV